MRSGRLAWKVNEKLGKDHPDYQPLSELMFN